MASDEDDRDVVVAFDEHPVQVEAALARHPDVEHETAGTIVVAAGQEVSRRLRRIGRLAGAMLLACLLVTLGLAAIGAFLALFYLGFLVILQIDLAGDPRFYWFMLMLTGIAKWTVTPRPGLFAAQMTPPCASMRDLAMESPMPIPAGLVV